MPTSSIFTNVKITDPKKAEAFINALDEAADAPYEKKERGESHILTDHEEIRKLMKKGLEDLERGSKRNEGEDYRSKAFVSTSKGYSAHYQIILGYNEAVTVLFHEIKDKRGSVDLLFYPMFFCARHSVELQFKLLIRLINNFNIFRKSELEKVELKGHNLEILSEKLNKVLEKSDRRLIAEYNKDKIRSLLSFFNEYDPTSQSFRYAVDNKGKRLLDKSIDILEHLDEYWDLFKFLEWIEEVISELYKEYRTKTYTKKLSRNDLELIAKRLPDKKEWGNQVFLDERERIKQDFNLSSNSDFDKALDVIKTNPYLCSLVGMEIPEEGFSDEFYLLYKEMKDTEMKIESRSYELRCKNQGFPSIISLEELCSDKTFSEYNSLLEGYVSRLTDNDCILYNTYRSIRKYCEEYEEQKIIISINLSSASLREYTCGKMSSTGFLRFEEGLQLCGRTTVLKKLGIPLKDNIDRRDFLI